MRQFMKKFTKDEAGVSAMEYALVASLVAIVIIAGVTLLGKNLNTVFSTVATSI